MRTATSKDFEELIPLVLASQLYQKKDLEQEQVDEVELERSSVKNVREWLADPTFYYVVAEEAGKIIGYCVVSVGKVYKDSGSLHDLYVADAYRKKGLAAAMLSDAQDWLRKQGVKQVDLAVHKDNTAALDLYHKMGWQDEPDDYRYLKQKL